MPAARGLLSRATRETLANYAYLLPAAICLGGTVLFPILKAIHMSLYQNVLSRPQDYHFIGLGNYVRMLHDPTFWLTLKNSVVWVFFSVSIQFVLGFLGALLLNASFKGRAFVRTLNLLPWIIPGVVVGLVWEYLYQPNYGPINDMLKRVGALTVPVAWLSEPAFAMASVIFANIWRGIPFFGIIILAGLQAVPQELHEAAAIDGANVWHRFRHVTIPAIKGVVLIASLLSIIWTFADFQLIYILTKGGPANQTHIFGTYAYQIGLNATEIGMGAAIALYMFPILTFFAILLLIYLRKEQ